jgi:hypothetical protein
MFVSAYYINGDNTAASAVQSEPSLNFTKSLLAKVSELYSHGRLCMRHYWVAMLFLVDPSWIDLFTSTQLAHKMHVGL